MSRSLTAIELGADSCVLARVQLRQPAVQVSAVHGVRPGDVLPDVNRAEHLRRIRRSQRFPKHARVVLWGVPESTSPEDRSTAPLLAPLLQAGFIVDGVMSPPEALTLLARQRPRAPGRGGAAWLALDRHAAAIAIVDDGDLKFSRVFGWNYRRPATPKDELLQRYSLVAHLAPELRHAFAVVRAEQGVTVDAIVTCGDLPDLRSLTMPLIEELDMEVETLDSLDGLEVAPPLTAVELRDDAPALRLACAAATGVTFHDRRAPPRRAVAAAAVLLAGAGIWAAAEWTDDGEVARQTARPAAAARSSPPPPQASQPAGATKSPEAGAAIRPQPVPEPPDPTPADVPDAAPDGAGSEVPAATTGLRGSRGPAAGETFPSSAASRERSRVADSPGRGSGTPTTTSPGTAMLPRKPPAQANAPLPIVNSIMVAPDRRLAVVDGVIVREGDAVGPRVLIRIEPDALVLRDPSGREVRVPIRRRLTGQ
jgi:hypothetical protein